MSTTSKRLIIGTLIGLMIVIGLAIIAWLLTKAVYATELPLGIPGKVLEYPLWAVLVGLAGNVLIRLFGIREFIKNGIRTELFLKIGLILLGAGINLTIIATAAGGAILQTAIIMPSVFFFSWWLAGKFKIEDKLRAIMSTAISVCGVSAAVAAAGSVSARKEHVTYITTLVILVALPMMVIAPLIAQALDLTEPVAGAWFGANIDTTAAVVGAGTIYGEQAQKIASIVKSTQNTMIGVVAFLLALWYATRSDNIQSKPGAHLIWDRFPKFILGFIVASILYSINLIDGGKGTSIDAIKNWAFTLAFVCMGLEFSISEFKKMGWRPVIVFLITTFFNTLLALGVSYMIFTHILPITI